MPPTRVSLGACRRVGKCNNVYYMVAKRTSRVLTVSVPPETAEAFDRLAESEGRNRSEMFREILRVYERLQRKQTFESLQRYGAAQAARVGVRTEKDVERLIREARD